MRPPEKKPNTDEFETLLDDEDRELLEKPDVPDDVKAEVTERLERRHEDALRRRALSVRGVRIREAVFFVAAARAVVDGLDVDLRYVRAVSLIDRFNELVRD